MPFISRTLAELNAASQAQLITAGYTDAQYAGTGIRTIIEATNFSLASFYNDLKANVSASYISRATAEQLDALALLVGLTRYSGESDNNFRFRITNSFNTSGVANVASLSQALLSLINVRDVIVKPFVHGVGTVAFYLVGTGALVDSATIALAKSTLDNMSAAGTLNIVLTPITVGVNVSCSITAAPTFASDMQVLRDAAATAITRYVSNLNMGDALIRAALEQAALNSSPYITNFQLITLSTTDTSGNTTQRLLRDYLPQYDEELIPGRIQVT